MPESKQTKIVIFILIVILLVGGFITFLIHKKGSSSIKAETKEIFSDSEDRERAYTDINGQVISLEKYLGRIMVVTSWASWSPFSKNDLLVLSEISEKYPEDKVVVIAINRKEGLEKAKRFVKTLPETVSTLKLALDPSDNFYNSISGFSMPTTVVYNQKGEVILRFDGVIVKEDLERLLDTALK